jgi:hypothetical protein
MLGIILVNFFRMIKRNYIKIIILFFVLAGIAVLGFFYQDNISYKNPDTILDGEAKIVFDKVNKLAVVPQNETPTLAKVSNPELLKDQAFFIDAKKGDVVLIFSNSKKAVLYDPVQNKIINMTTINLGDVKKPDPTNLKDTETKSFDSNEF